ncbi:SdpI family protein [Companilactobacillus halodurans]|nr:SdpI family protein [Companilactobacillus halodurans]
MKRQKVIPIISFLVIWLPLVFELIFWKKLPAKLLTHFNAQMVADSYSSKTMAVLLLPGILTVAQIFMLYIVFKDLRKKTNPIWMLNLVSSIFPIVSVMLSLMTLSTAFGIKLQNFSSLLINIAIGILLVILGFILRGVKPNGAIGIRLKWTLQSKKNWQLTNYFAANLSLIVGILLIICGLLSVSGMIWFILLTVMLLPCLYSYTLYKRGI